MEIYSLQKFSCVSCDCELMPARCGFVGGRGRRSKPETVVRVRSFPIYAALLICIWFKLIFIRRVLRRIVFLRGEEIFDDVLRWETEERELGGGKRWRTIGGEEVVCVEDYTWCNYDTSWSSTSWMGSFCSPSPKTEVTKSVSRRVFVSTAQLTIALHIWCPKSQVVSK